jgi:hypothetical protein
LSEFYAPVRTGVVATALTFAVGGRDYRNNRERLPE